MVTPAQKFAKTIYDQNCKRPSFLTQSKMSKVETFLDVPGNSEHASYKDLPQKSSFSGVE
jgi:hypothetical protein